jgi:thiamine-monophosphate kinase
MPPRPLPPPRVVRGGAPDAAVVAGAKNARIVLTTDALVEGVHFDWAFSTAGDVGHKALAVNLSDLAAMGAEPSWALLSLALPGATAVDTVDALVDGLVEVATANRVALVGGNLTRSPGPLVVDVTAVGTVEPRRILTRDGGRPGDTLYVSGTIGAARAGLEMLKAGVANQPCVDRHRRPIARVRLGYAIARGRAARAAMDLSDGLADAVHQMAEASGCGAEIDASTLPVDACARQWWEARNTDPIVAALSGGDDYELLIAVPARWRGRLRHVRTRVAHPPLTRIGVLTKNRRERVLVRDGRRADLPAGFEHW